MTRFLPGRRRLSRRTMLKGLLGGAAVSVGLPALEIMLNDHGTALASGGGLPLRFGLFLWANGILPPRWVPEEVGPGYALSDQLAPLEAVRDRFSVITGMKVQVVNEVPHGSGPSGLLAGGPLIIDGDNHTYPGPTIDQVMASAIGQTTRFRSLEFGAEPGGGLSYNGPNSQNPPESSPHALFQRIFGVGFTAPGEEPILDPTVGLRRSVLDAITVDAEALQKRLGAADKIRVEQHLDGIRELEKQLAYLEADPPSLAACAAPAEPLAAYPDIDGHAQIAEKNDAFSSLLAMALACDQTRVFSDYVTRPLSDVLYDGMTMGHHQLTHDELGEQPQVHEIVLMQMAHLRGLIEALDAVEEGDGTLLDHCLILGTSDLSFGKTHNIDEYPLLLAGGGCGGLRLDYHYRSQSGESASKLMVSVGRIMGLGWNEYGTGDAYVDEGLEELEL